jgi:hypothetical protein
MNIFKFFHMNYYTFNKQNKYDFSKNKIVKINIFLYIYFLVNIIIKK